MRDLSDCVIAFGRSLLQRHQFPTLGPGFPTIASKYMIESLCSLLIREVVDDWSTTLEGWGRQEAELGVMRRARSCPTPIRQYVPVPASAIRFMLEFGCPETLPRRSTSSGPPASRTVGKPADYHHFLLWRERTATTDIGTDEQRNTFECFEMLPATFRHGFKADDEEEFDFVPYLSCYMRLQRRVGRNHQAHSTVMYDFAFALGKDTISSDILNSISLTATYCCSQDRQSPLKVNVDINYYELDPTTPLLMSGAIRLAHKYLIDSLRTRLIRQVSDDWPLSLHEWDQQEAEALAIADAIATDPAARPVGSQHLADCVPEPAAAILARIRADDDWPATSPPRVHGLGRRRGVATSLNLTPAPAAARAPRALAPPRARHAAAVHARLRAPRRLPTRRALPEGIGGALSAACRPWWAWPGVAPAGGAREFEDARAHPCFEFLRALFEDAWRRQGEAAGARGRDPLRALKECLEWERAPAQVRRACPQGLCRRCAGALEGWVPDMRQALWKRLPEYFELV
ncbi:uncharacterized protein BXZ73DRAFT_103493 [Epithele typhae]|uniref:uncharacterized protein n=1 Tax=Epithele typhae TaxID=378194 RepID=UPI002008303A|nr:uncharacterized protein BXZ73DRAFT_103493 [Epithele typhae]KAH9924655.1 hypothetical protein BXZ73DRAFT_103493 [Epithele typhae]